jgi:flagellar motor switch protein FliM
VIFSNFARRLQSIFASELGKSVEVNFDGMEILSYEQLIQGFPLPASIHAVRLEPLRGIGVSVIEARLAFAMVELFFGGAGQTEVKVEGRDFTPIESRFLGKFVERMLMGMEEAWHPTMPVRGRYLRSEMNPYLLNAAGMGDAMIAAPYKINMSPISGTILFSLPLAAIEELREKLKAGIPLGDDSENGGISKRLHQPLLDVELEVQAVVDVVSLNVGEIMRMRPGDIIQLSAPGLHEVRLCIEGLPKFMGKAAERNGNKVFVAGQPVH